MAKFSQSKVSPTQEDNLKKTLHALDSRVVMPESLRGSALLAKLEGVQPDVPTKKKVSELVLPKRNRVRFLVGYAAAFALVIGLFYNLSLNRPVDLALGEVPIGGQMEELTQLQEGGGASPGGITRSGMPAGEITINPEAATRLGEFGQYLLYHHPNSDRLSQFPYLLLILDADGQAVISQIELPPQMSQIYRIYINGNLVSLESREGQQRFIYSIDLTDPHNPLALQ